VAHVPLAGAEELERVQRALPQMVPADIVIKDVQPVSPAFHACSSATARRYSYHLLLGKDIFRNCVLQVDRHLDRAAMDQAAAALLGTHDFTSFCKSSSLKEDGNECSVDLCELDWTEDSAIFHVRANRFLHHMVRNMVGTLVEIGRGSQRLADIPAVIAARDRRVAGRMAPPQGLFLEEVSYPAKLLDPHWREPESGQPGSDSVGEQPGSEEGDAQ
jgi:tRNA pseudouridine38-40 synthase